MADYDILENWEGPTTENKDWREKLDQGIREDIENKKKRQALEDKKFRENISKDMIESGSDELDDSPWYSDPEFYEAMVGWGEPGLGTAGDVGRDLWNQGMMFADFLGHTSPATLLMGGGGDSIFKDMMFKGDVYDKIYSHEDYRDVEKKRKNAESDKRFMQNIIETGSLTKNQVRALNEAFGENRFKEGDLSLSDTSLFNEIVLKIDTELAREDDDIIAEWRAAETEAKGLPWYDLGNYDLATMGKTAINEMFTPSNVAADNPYKDLANKIRIGGNIAPFVVSPITSAARTVGSKIAPITTKAIANSRFGSLLKNLKPSGIFPSLVNRLPKSMQETVRQLLPVTSGKGTFFPTRAGGTSFKPTTWNPLTWGRKVTNRNWMDANTLRNFGIAGTMQGGKYLFGDNEARAADILTNPQYDPVFGDRDPVIFDDYMQEKIQNFKPTPRGPGPWNEFEG